MVGKATELEDRPIRNTGGQEGACPFVLSFIINRSVQNMDNDKLAAELYEASKHFCEQIANIRAYDETNVEDLLNALSGLLKKAWFLPIIYPDDSVSDIINDLIMKLYSEMPEDSPTYQLYHISVLDIDCSKLYSLASDEKEFFEIYGCFPGDFLDMYPEIIDGMLLYEHGYTEYAIIEWASEFHIHWSWHIRGAIMSFYKICRDLRNRKIKEN